MPTIEEILKELIEFEPELKKCKKELFMIVKTMIEAKPDTKFNQEFAQNLRAKLISNLSYAKPNTSHFTPIKKLSYLLSGILLTLIVVSIGHYGINSFKSTRIGTPQKKLVSFTQNILEVKENAFGKLTPYATETVGRGGGGGGSGEIPETKTESSATSETSPDTTISSVEEDAPETPEEYWPTIYKYVYTGGDFTLDTDKISVLKRIPGTPSSAGVFDILKNFDLGLMDTSKLKNAYIDYISASENRDFGYSLSLNVFDESLTVNSNYIKWPQCYDQDCYSNQKQLTIEDVPSDKTLIKITDDFLKEYGIDKSKTYGDPFIRKDQWWKPYMSDYISVIYPQIINGLEVYEEIGNKSGITFTVDIRNKKVSSVAGLKSQNYENSKYNSIDKDFVMKIAEKGGINNYFFDTYTPNSGEKVKEVTIKLKTPVKGYIQKWDYKGNITEELLIEALIFPIAEPSSNEIFSYQQAVVVPLAKDLTL